MFTLSKSYLSENVCYLSSQKTLSSHDFLSLVSGTLDYLKDYQRVALCFEESSLFAVSVFACLASNKSVVILPNNKAETLDRFNKEFDVILNEESFLKINPKSYSEFKISKDAPILFFTSGSSGVAKKVLKRFENLYIEMLELEKKFGEILKNSTILATVTHQHIYGFLFKILWPICFKRTFISTIIEYPEQLASCKNSFALISSPAFLKRYVLSESVSNCTAIFSSGGLLSYEAALQIKNSFGIAPIEVYGSTESGGVAYRERIHNHQSWIPFSDIKISIVSDGQLSIESPYFDASHLLMGDTVEFTDGGFKLLGRIDDVVKIEEKRVSLVEINQKILEVKWIRESIVIAMEENGRQLTACLATLNSAGEDLLERSGELFLIREIRFHLQKYFEPTLVPRKFRFVKNFPYNSQSKLVKTEVMEYFK